MQSNGIYGGIALLGVSAAASWIFSCEVLFVLGVVLTLAMSSITMLILGSLIITEKVMLAREREKAEWSVSPKTSMTGRQ